MSDDLTTKERLEVLGTTSRLFNEWVKEKRGELLYRMRREKQKRGIGRKASMKEIKEVKE